jgi:hypothetical protein
MMQVCPRILCLSTILHMSVTSPYVSPLKCGVHFIPVMESVLISSPNFTQPNPTLDIVSQTQQNSTSNHGRPTQAWVIQLCFV